MNLHLSYPPDPRKQEQSSAYLDSPHALSFLEPVPLPRQVFSLPPVRYNTTISMDQRGPLPNGMSSSFRPTNSVFGTTTLMNQHPLNNQPHGPSVVQHHIIHHHHWPSQNSLTQLQGLPPPVTSSKYSLATVSETSHSDPEAEQELPEPIASSSLISPATSASSWEASIRGPQQQQRNRHQIHGVDLDLLQIEIEPLSAWEEEEEQEALYLDGLSSSSSNNNKTPKPKLKKTSKKKSKSAPKLLLNKTLSATSTPSPLNDVSTTTISSSATSGPSGAGTRTRWEERYEELKAYKERFGDCCVPSQWKENPSLAQWTKRQRYQLRLRKYGKHSTMTAAREALLEQLDFCWDPHETFWNERLAELEAYREEHGHCNVPTKYAPNPQLAIWAKCQRRQMKIYLTEGPSRSNMTSERIEKLKSLGFVFNPRGLRRASLPDLRSLLHNNNNPHQETAAAAGDQSIVSSPPMASSSQFHTSGRHAKQAKAKKRNSMAASLPSETKARRNFMLFGPMVDDDDDDSSSYSTLLEEI